MGEAYEVIAWDTMGRDDVESWVEVGAPQQVVAHSSLEAAQMVSGESRLFSMGRTAGPGMFLKSSSRDSLVYEVLCLQRGGSLTPDASGRYQRLYKERRGIGNG